MLLCRHILRVHTPNLIPAQRLVQRHVRDGTFLSLRPRHVNIATREGMPKVAVQPSIAVSKDQPPDPRADLLESVLRVSRYSVPKEAKRPKLVGKETVGEKAKHGPFEAYTELRAQDPAFPASLPTEVLCRLAEGAVKHGSQAIVDSLTADVLDSSLLLEEQRAPVAAALLCIPCRFTSLLDKRTLLSLLTIIDRQDELSVLPAPAASYIMKRVIDDPLPNSADESLMNFVLPTFLKHVGSLQAPTGTKAMSYRPPDAIFTAYGLVNELVTLHRRREALDLFQTLTETAHVPAETFQQVDVSSPLAQDFAVIIRSTLARACLHWGWHHRGVGLIAAIVKSQNAVKADFGPLALELLHSALETCSPAQFEACGWLMCQLTNDRHRIIIPEETVHLFYRRASRVGDAQSAGSFYSHAQSRQVKTVVDYPAPKGPALIWLMSHFVDQKHNVHLARSLTKQVVDTSVAIPRFDRARFIALAASHGFATEARALWEKYSTGPAGAQVIGNAATMIRMVSLFAQRDSRSRAKLEMLESLRAQGLVEESEPQEHEQQKQSDYSEFAHRVLRAFHDSIKPLEKAGHFDLSALARGYFMLGYIPEGLQPFRILLRRKEIPDTHDINVALSAMARHSPRAASQMVDRMLHQGLRLDAVTFGTVLHQAIVHGDLELVTDVLERARELGLEELSSKTMATLIRTSVAIGEETDDDTLEANVQRAWDMIRSTPESSVVHTPNIGKCCILASLHLDDPVMAFNFWDRLVRGKTEWADREQMFQRRLIGKMIRRHCHAGRLDRDRGRVMLLELGDRGGV
ncbi:hypothetical protein HYDPIDRAFT_114283 [Hydnomerulius pinastri MD-312]|uniref:Uncharacterized protein n=1 Tax=Hydnomerulius pinastri MD-312 TaxID=994086 RepID=A0A0C9WDM8_9AGAM|nr:hypothetical protein HYDPIDRAFT_114283 [Hydnomerulius pinastri MD-312]